MCKFKQFIAQDCGHVASLELEEKCQMAERVPTWEHCPRHNPQNQFTEVEVPGSCHDCGGDTKGDPEQDWSQGSRAEFHSESDPDRDVYEDPPHHEPIPQGEIINESADEEDYQRILRETAEEARRNEAAHEDDFEAQVRQAMAASAQEYGVWAGGNTEDELERALAASTEEHQAQTEDDFEAQLARILAASEAEAPKSYFQSLEEEEEAVRRLMAESAAEHQHNTAADEEEEVQRIMEESARAFREEREAQEDVELRRIMEESRLSWQQSSWGGPARLEDAFIDPSIDPDPREKGKGPRNPNWKPDSDLSGALSSLSLSKDDHPRRWAEVEEEDDAASQHSNGKSISHLTLSTVPVMRNSHTSTLALQSLKNCKERKDDDALAESRAIRALQDAAYKASAAADRKKALLKREMDKMRRAHLKVQGRMHEMFKTTRLHNMSATSTAAVQTESPQLTLENLLLAEEVNRNHSKANNSSTGADEGLQTPGALTKQNDSIDDESDETYKPRTPSALRRARLATLDRLQQKSADDEESNWTFDNL